MAPLPGEERIHPWQPSTWFPQAPPRQPAWWSLRLSWPDLLSLPPLCEVPGSTSAHSCPIPSSCLSPTLCLSQTSELRVIAATPSCAPQVSPSPVLHTQPSACPCPGPIMLLHGSTAVCLPRPPGSRLSQAQEALPASSCPHLSQPHSSPPPASGSRIRPCGTSSFPGSPLLGNFKNNVPSARSTVSRHHPHVLPVSA